MFQINDTVFIITNKHFIEEGIIVHKDYYTYTVKYTSRSGGLKVTKSRLFPTKQDAIDYMKSGNL